METTLAVESIAQQNLDVSRSYNPQPHPNYDVSTHYSTISLAPNTRHTTPVDLFDEMNVQRILVPLFLPG